MQIQTATNIPTGTISTDATQRVAATSGDGKAAAVTTSTSFSPTTDLAKLLAAVKELPDVRADVVADATGRVGSGELLTQLAATETAQAAIDDLRLL
jgi:hypothetical protein